MIQVSATDDKDYILEFMSFEGEKQNGNIVKYVNMLLTKEEVKVIKIKKWKDA